MNTQTVTQDPGDTVVDAPKRLILGLYIAMALAGSLLIFTNLGGRCIFGDERHTATTAMAFLRTGLPLTNDDYPVGWTTTVGSCRVLTLHPWCDPYLAALSVRLLGRTAFALRLPFALIGVAFLVLLLALGRRLLVSRRALLILALLALCCLPLLLFLRAARYYTPTLFMITALAVIWNDLEAGPSRRGLRSLACLYSILLAFTFWPAGLVTNAFLLLMTFLTGKRGTWRLPLPGLLVAVLFYLAVRSGSYNVQQLAGVAFSDRLHGILFMLVEVNRYYLPLWMLVFLPVTPLRGKGILAAFCAAMLLAFNFGAFYAARYLVPLVPLLLVAAAAIWDRIIPRSPLVATVLLLLVVGTNLPAAMSWYLLTPAMMLPGVATRLPSQMDWPQAMAKYGSLRPPILDALLSLPRLYYGSTEGMVDFLRAHARPGERVLVQENVFSYQYHLPDLKIVMKHYPDSFAAYDWIVPNCYQASRPHEIVRLREDLSRGAEAHGFRREETDIPDWWYGNPWPDEYIYAVPDTASRMVLYRAP